jgi:hypothetical protein
MGLFKLSKKQLENAAEKPLPSTAYPQIANTGNKIGDFFFNWIVNRYRNLRNSWTKSDNFMWKGACYTFPELIGIIIFFTIFWLLINFSLKKYGEARTLFYLILIVLLRINVMIKQLVVLNKKY